MKSILVTRRVRNHIPEMNHIAGGMLGIAKVKLQRGLKQDGQFEVAISKQIRVGLI